MKISRKDSHLQGDKPEAEVVMLMNDSLVTSPWKEHFQIDCVEAEEIQPHFHFKNFYEKYIYLREILPLRSNPNVENIFSITQFSNEALIQALRFLFYGSIHPPIYPDLSVRYNLVLNCQLALLWALIGKIYNHPDFTKASQSLAGWLKPLVMADLTTLWMKEEHFNEIEIRFTMGIFLDVIGELETGHRYYSPILPKSRFFSWLHSQKLKINIEENFSKSLLIQNQYFSFSIADYGEKIPLGAFSAGKIKIPSMGPLVGNL